MNFHFNIVSLKIKNKEMNKETFVSFDIEQKYIVQMQEEIYSYKVKNMNIFGWRNIHLYT